MKAKLNETLLQDFPELCSGISKPPTENLFYGFHSVQDGWYDLIYQLCEDITTFCTKNNYRIPQIAQVKEKFGGLRFYIDGAEHEQIFQIIHAAENDSFKVCEVCGTRENVETRGKYWVKTQCEECREE